MRDVVPFAPGWVSMASGMHQPVHLSLASNPCPVTVCATAGRARRCWSVTCGPSTAEQRIALEGEALLAAGIAPERIYEDMCSGTVADRPGLVRALDVLRDGDILVVWKLDRIGRSLAHVHAVVLWELAARHLADTYLIALETKLRCRRFGNRMADETCVTIVA